MIRVEELTYFDIRRCVTGNLDVNTGWLHEFLHSPDAITEKIQLIVYKAHGVFLWVKLVVQLILKEIGDGSYSNEVEKLIEDVPDDLIELYSHMLKNIKDGHQESSARIFQLALIAESWSPLLALSPYFAETAS